MQPRLLATMITTTSYGAWLPGDLRGFVENGQILPGDPDRLELATQRMAGSPVVFTKSQQLILFDSLQAACVEFHYELTDSGIESWHLHWMCNHGLGCIQKPGCEGGTGGGIGRAATTPAAKTGPVARIHDFALKFFLSTFRLMSWGAKEH